MSKAPETISTDQFQLLPTNQVFESPLNPRRTYNEAKMEELTESIRNKGILIPLLVRPNNGRFEIAAGHRRYRAAVKVKLTVVPLLVREMNDIDFLEVLTFENLMHEDMEPLDEAQGYQTLIEKADHNVCSISARIGKSESYVYQRLKLLDLIPKAQEQLAKNEITAGHAILIARLQPNEQKEVLKQIEDEKDYNPMSVRDLSEYIERNIHLDLNSASFSKKDPTLVPGPCTTCPKRTGFSDKKKTCKSAKEGIITEGQNLGKVLLVCVDPECKVHHGRPSPSHSSSPEDSKWRAERKAADEKKKQGQKIRLRIIDEILSGFPGEFSKEDLTFLAQQLFDELWSEYQKRILARY